MAYQAMVIPVMIASPSDVVNERELIRQVLHDWNCINSQSTSLVLMPVGWETHSSPELGNRPQQIINNKLLKECDILIGVFWTRLGSPTGDFSSGTVEEIEEHLKANRHVMLYFSNKPIPQHFNREQLEELERVKDKYKSLGLVDFYEDETDFKSKLNRHLQITLNKNEYLLKLKGKAGVSEALVIEEKVERTISSYLNDDAKTLLRMAATKTNGVILSLVSMTGRHIKIGDAIYGGDGREAARWEHALKILSDNDLVFTKGKGQVFELTARGWHAFDELMGDGNEV